MSDEQKELDWQSEAENLSEGGDGAEYWSPDEGQQEVTFLDDGVGYEDQKKFDDAPRSYVKFRVEVDGTEFIWDMAKGSTPGSKFGQIARYASRKGGLEGESITWFRQGEGQQTNHVLMDLSEMNEDEGDDGKDPIFDDDGEESGKEE